MQATSRLLSGSRRHHANPIARAAALFSAIAIVVAACGSTTSSPTASGPTPTPWSPTPAPASPSASPTPTASPTPAGIVFPIAVVTRYDDARPNISAAQLLETALAGKILVPCEASNFTLNGTIVPFYGGTTCLPAAEIAARMVAIPKSLALLPPGLVTPSVKVLPIGTADLFGSPKHRAEAYPLNAITATPAAWTAYEVADIRTLISTGDTCPDRGVSFQAVTSGKGWDWTLSGGTVKYGKLYWSYWNWKVPTIGRTGNPDAVAELISDNDVGVNDFECAMLTNWKQHDTGMRFNVDPAVAKLLAVKGGVKTVTIGSNHISDAGTTGIRQTLQYLDEAGIAHTGAGMNLDQALAPAIVEVRGLKFAFVGWDDGSGPSMASATTPGAASLTHQNVCNSIKNARTVADVVIAQPQWGFPEYHNDITSQQIRQRKWMYDCGADGILGSGTHWASWASILPGPTGPRFAIGSHGNFLFDQSWSRPTMEGVIVEATYAGTKLVQFRLHPYIIVEKGQPNLIDPTTDGKVVLDQVWSVSEVR
jgi:hypothetical protein